MQDLGKTAESSGGGFNALQEIATGALRKIGEMVVNVGAMAFSKFGEVIGDSISAAKESNMVAAQTAQVIKSTGSAAGVTADHVLDYASALSAASGKSLFGDEQIAESSNLLLTFTNIRGATLDAATAISVDMAQALGGAPKDAAIQLGKALNDPVKGITALTRVGVTFSDEQKAQIQAMQEAGDTAGAQAVILSELNKEFGGSAQAAADADGGFAQFQDRLGEMEETIGKAILPVLGQLMGVLNDTLLPIVENAATVFGQLMSDFTDGGIGVLADDLREMFGIDIMPFVTGIQNVIVAVQDFASALIENFQGAQGATSSLVGDLGYFLDTITGVGEDVRGPFQTAFESISNVITTQLIPAFNSAVAFIQTQFIPFVEANLTPILSGFAAMIIAVVVPAFIAWAIAAGSAAIATIVAMAPIIAVIAAIGLAVGLLVAAWENDWGGIQEKVAAVWAILQPIFNAVVTWLQTNITIAIQAASDFFNTILVPALQAVWAFIQTNVLPIFGEIAAWLNTTIPAATQTTSSFWSGTLLPALNSVWAFIQNFVVPLFTALVQLHLAVLGLAVRTLTAVWNTELLPALNSIWKFIQINLGPIIDWLTVTILKPLWSILGDIYYTVLGTLLPVLTKLSSLVKDEVAHAFNSLSTFAGDAAGGLSKIGGAVHDVIGYINDLVAKLNSVSVPDWLQGHSPPPMADWFSYIAESVKGVNAQLPTLAMNLAAQIGPSGQSVTNTASTRSFTYAPQYNGGGAVEGPMDLALANSLAGV